MICYSSTGNFWETNGSLILGITKGDVCLYLISIFLPFLCAHPITSTGVFYDTPHFHFRWITRLWLFPLLAVLHPLHWTLSLSVIIFSVCTKVLSSSIYYKYSPVSLIFPLARSIDNLSFTSLNLNLFCPSQVRGSYCVLRQQINISCPVGHRF